MPRMINLFATLIYLIGFRHAATWRLERTEDQCEIAIKEVMREDRAIIEDDSLTRLHFTWLSQECEVRAGPEYVIRKYTFFQNGTFLLLRYHYAEESCSVATHTIVTRGSIELGLPSTLVSGATEAKFRIDIVHIIPLNRQVANKFGHRLNVTCNLQPKWRPYVAQPIYERVPHQFESFSWYGPRYNSLQSYPSSKKEKAIDCLEILGIDFDELSLLRVQKRPFNPKLFASGSVFKSKIELALGDVPLNVQSRWIRKLTSLQSTTLIRMDTMSGCPICGSIFRGTEYNPPLLHEVAPLPALLGGSWISSQCESVKGGLWSRRHIEIYSGDKLWAGRWDYHVDPRCTVFFYSITAAGSYVQRARRHKRERGDAKPMGIFVDSLTNEEQNRLRRNLDDTYHHLFRNARPSMVESFATMLRGNQQREEVAKKTQISSTPSGTTELDLHVAESVLIPGDASIVSRCGGKEVGRPLSLWPRNCIPLAIEAPSTLGLRAKVDVSWMGQYILRLGPRDENIWNMPLHQCGPTSSHNPKLRTYIRKSLGFRYGLRSSAASNFRSIVPTYIPIKPDLVKTNQLKMSFNDSTTLNHEIIKHFTFGWIDYTLFGMILSVSVLIGIYFGFFSKQDTTTEYFLGGKRMGFFPIAMSIIASHVSGITLLGVPSEVYQHGSQYSACVITSILSCSISAYIFLPVFYKLQLTSTFEYLEIRFNKSVRILCSILFVISLLMYIPIVVYVPALAFSQVTDFSLHTVTPILCTVCIIYTSIGGLKAVVWTDTIQFSVTIGGLFAVLFLGINSVGGVSEIWKRSEMGNRLIFFDMDASPFARNTFWGMSIGMTVTWLVHLGIHQGCVQRCLSIPKERDAKRALGVTAIGLIIVKLFCVFIGLTMFAKYYNCDPLLTKIINRADQTLPYYVMDVAENVPGLPGLFLAGLVSAALATMSASLNTISGTIYEDFISSWIPDGPRKEARATTIMKIIVLVVGAVSVGLVFAVERLGTVFQMAISIRSVTDGPSLGLFTLGMLVPWSNARGALLGGGVSLIAMFILAGGSQWYIANGRIRNGLLPTSVEGCPYPLNETIITTQSPLLAVDEEPMSIFAISFMYFTMIGTLITIIVGIIGSYVFGNVNLAEIDPNHITPIMQRFLPRKDYKEVPLNSMPEEVEKKGYADRIERRKKKLNE
ncbi:hypothetical protein KPH14_003309 [Odynerus spinipes]|uniref:FHA domain-containing protein n=1 Tax=Odynerus spinipes TaxID=1348599 RepID=A0AAD9RCJ9_9HYME|nr:hypothetical protein KPH14_003309 [Odynerus spinipes]